MVKSNNIFMGYKKKDLKQLCYLTGLKRKGSKKRIAKRLNKKDE